MKSSDIVKKKKKEELWLNYTPVDKATIHTGGKLLKS